MSKARKSMFLEKDPKAEEGSLLLCLNVEINPTIIKLVNTTGVLISWFMGRETNVMKPVKV